MASVKEWETKQWYLFADLIYRHWKHSVKKKLINQFKKTQQIISTCRESGNNQ